MTRLEALEAAIMSIEVEVMEMNAEDGYVEELREARNVLQKMLDEEANKVVDKCRN